MQAGGILREAQAATGGRIYKHSTFTMARFLTDAEKACIIEMEIRAGRARRPIDMKAIGRAVLKGTALTLAMFAFGFIAWIILGMACMEEGHSAKECRGDWSLQSAKGV